MTRTHHTNDRDRAAYLRSLAKGWATDLRRLGPRPRHRFGGNKHVHRARCEAWEHRSVAIAGAADVADALEHGAVLADADRVPPDVLEVRAVELRRVGLTFAAVASSLGIPIGTAKTWCRRARLAQAGAA